MRPPWPTPAVESRTRGVALGGFMGVGKSTVGPIVAQLLGLPFADLDHLIETEARTSVRDLFDQQGERVFRALETNAIRQACQQPPHVLALGGGALHEPGNLALLRDAFDVIVLTAPLDAIQARLSTADIARRPLWSALSERYAQRQPGYRAAGPSVLAHGAPPVTIAARVVEVLAQ